MTTLSPAERSYITTGLASSTPTREDGRGLLVPRALGVSYGDAPAANGSARVQIGNTEVVAGIKLEVVDCAPGTDRWRAKVEVDV
jgi:exosome complex component RRP42